MLAGWFRRKPRPIPQEYRYPYSLVGGEALIAEITGEMEKALQRWGPDAQLQIVMPPSMAAVLHNYLVCRVLYHGCGDITKPIPPTTHILGMPITTGAELPAGQIVEGRIVDGVPFAILPAEKEKP